MRTVVLWIVAHEVTLMAQALALAAADERNLRDHHPMPTHGMQSPREQWFASGA